MVGRFSLSVVIASFSIPVACGAAPLGTLRAVLLQPDEPSEKAPVETRDDAPSDTPKPEPKAVKPEEKKPVVVPAQVVGSSSRTAKAAQCESCRGDGQAAEERSGPAKETVPGVRTPSKVKVEVRCKKCNGTGLSHATRLANEMKDFARQLGRVNDSDDRWPAASEKVLENLRDLTKFGASAWSRLNNNKLRTMISQNKDPIGEAIFFVGKLESDDVVAAPEGGMALRSMRIELGGNGGNFVFERPLVVDCQVGQGVLCGGVIGRRAIEGGGFVVYVDRGYVVRFDGPANDLNGDR